MQWISNAHALWPKRTAAVLLALATTLGANAQVFDNFSDGDLSANPAWQGEPTEFKVNTALELQLNGPDAGTSSLYLPTVIADSAVWELYFRLEFDPSASNRLRIVLQSDSSDPTTANAYYLLIGVDGSGDAIQFYRQDAGTSILLASTAAGSVASAPSVRLRMTRELGGVWKLSADYTGGQNLVPQFEASDATYPGGNSIFGFYCIYTATRKDKFFFDDINLQPLLPDTQAPVLLTASAVSATEVDVFFNENLEETAADDPANYQLDNGIGQPSAAFLDAIDKTLVHLSLSSPLQNLTTYTLTTNGLVDLAGNLSASQTASFTYVEVAQPVEYDILINEIMADPTPQIGLPNVEYVELYNRSNKVLELGGFRFSAGGTPQVFPSYQILPDAYLIVCDDANVDSLASFGNVLGLGSFPALTNFGDDLSLADPNGNIISEVSYRLEWYGDFQKQDGGWSLELVSPLAPCRGSSNWRGSANLLGGTPGQPNSVLDPQPDLDPPAPTGVFATPDRPNEVQLFFDEKLDIGSATDPANYGISGGLNILSVSFLPPYNYAVVLQLSGALQQSTAYEVTVQNVADCSGNPLAGTGTLSFALPEQIEPNDLVINEVLFNPYVGGSDFVEVYNRSQKVLNIGDLIIGNIEAGIDTVSVNVAGDRLIFPGEYIVFTEERADILSRYKVQDTLALVSNDLPAFNDDAGNVTLYRAGAAGAVVIDVFDYSEGFHHPLLDETEGVSLERLHPDGASQDASNWHSASEGAGWATPTYRNSQYFENQSTGSDLFEIPEPSFSPDGDGDRDFLAIYYKVDKLGYAAKVRIFDAEGRFVKSIANNELLGTEGFLRWDGDTDDGDKAKLGIYVLALELFNPDGTVHQEKRACVVAGRL